MLAPDGFGGAFVAFQDDQHHVDVLVQRLNHQGLSTWKDNGVSVSDVPFARGLTNRAAWGHPRVTAIVPDAANGMLVVWHERREATGFDIYGQRLTKDGLVAPGWPTEGLRVCAALGDQMDAVLVPDGKSGAIVTWRDSRPGPSLMDVYVQRITAAGTVAPGWPADGVALCTADGDQQLPSLASDGKGGAIVTWYDFRDDWAGDVFAQRVNEAGGVQWAKNGVRVCGAPGLQRESMLVSDGSGGAVIAWHDHRGRDFDLYAQRLTAEGVPAVGWPQDGIPVCTARGDQKAGAIATDASSGTRFAWVDSRSDSDGDIYAQWLDERGRRRWGGGGLPVCVERGGQRQPSLATDDRGGMLVAWVDFRSENPGQPPSPGDIYAQKIDGRGIAQWAVNGTLVCNASGDQQLPVVLSDGGEGAFLAWADYRSGSFSDLFAATISTYTPRAPGNRRAESLP
jgi:hypothetical protein